MIGPYDPTDRLSADDLATRREEQFLAAALSRQAALAKAPAAKAGVCTNCCAACLPQVVYCDDDCRADHESRRRILARQGKAG